MSNVCCKEFTGWLKSFTKVERALTVLEAVLLAVLIALLIMLILHLVTCSQPAALDSTSIVGKNSSNYDHEAMIEMPAAESEQLVVSNTSESAIGPTANDVKCSWTPSAKTTAAKHYYEDSQTSTPSSVSPTVDNVTYIPTHTIVDKMVSDATGKYVSADGDPLITKENYDTKTTNPDPGATLMTTPFEELEELIRRESSDGEEAESEYKRHIVALVKLKPPKDIIFGCILTIIGEYWTLTAASCIEAIEEMDSLDSFVIMEDYGNERSGLLRTVEDVRVHPRYEGRRRAFDVAALRCGRALPAGRRPLPLASFLDYALLTLAQRLTILGYGAFRTIESGARGRRLRQAAVWRVPDAQCAGAGAGGAALRHLSGGRAAAGGACGPRALCAGVLHARALPCNYCAGAPLLLARADGAPALLGLLADGECGVACEPALYVNLADDDVADWIDATLRDLIQ